MRVINKHLILLVSFLVSFGNFIFGYSLVAISMMEEPIATENSLNGPERDYQLSIITTLLPLGGFLATFLTNSITNLFGERKAMIYLDIFAFLTITYQAHHISIVHLYMTRFFLGAYLGISSSILPSYLVSISPPELSGLIGSFQQLLITIGISVAYRLGYSGLD